MRRFLTVFLAVFLTIGLVPVMGVASSVDERRSGAVTLVREGQPDAVIVYWSGETSPTPEFAATELRDYVAAMSGAELPVVQASLRGRVPPELASGVAVVTGPEARGFEQGKRRIVPSSWVTGVAQRLEGKGADAFAADTGHGRLVLAGTTHRGTLYAAYEVLERLGVRFFAPQFDFYQDHAEYVPQRSTVTVESLTFADEPSFTYRRKFVEEGRSHTADNLPQLIDWMAKARLNILVYPYDYVTLGLVEWETWREQLTPELERRDMLLEVGGHGYDSFLPPEEHPQYYTSGTNVFDVDNEEAVAAYTDEVVAYLKQRPEIDIFDAWPPDGARWPDGATEKFGSIANAHAHVTNELHAAVDSAELDVEIEAIAYSRHIELPDADQMFESSTIIDFAPYDRSYTTPIYDDTHPSNAFYNDLIARWAEAYSGPLALYEYYRKYSWHSLPVVMPELIGQEMPYFHAQGITGFGIYSEPADWMTYEVTHLLVAELSWNVDLDTGDWLRTYLEERYGTVADAMGEYFEHVEEAGRTLFDRAAGNYGDLEVVSRARDGFLSAREAVGQAHDQAAPGTSGALLTRRLMANADFAVADTEIRYYGLRGEEDAQIEAKRRTQELVEAHRFDGIIMQSMWTMRSYASGMTGSVAYENTRWTYRMYRQHEQQPPTPPPGGVSYLSDLSWSYAGNTLGPVEKDMSVGGPNAADGNPLTISGHTYAKGLGTSPYSVVSYHVGGTCKAFTARVGIDDEVKAGSVEPDTGLGDPEPGFRDTWDLRDQEHQQVVVGTEEGTRAVMGSTEAAESSDPAWVASPTADSNGDVPVVPSLDGDDDIITLPDLAGNDLSQGFAAEAWAYQRTRGSAARIINVEGEGGFLTLYVRSDGRLNVNLRSADGELAYATSRETVSLNTWTHIGLIYDVDATGAVVRILVNGDEVTYTRQSQLTGTTALSTDELQVTIGNRTRLDRGFDGLVAYSRLAAPKGAMETWHLELFPAVPTGSVIFQVWGDDTKAYDSGVMTSAMPAKEVNVALDGVENLRLVVLDAFDGQANDHADWADAHLTCRTGE